MSVIYQLIFVFFVDLRIGTMKKIINNLGNL